MMDRPIPHVSIPTPGHYQLRLAKGAPWSPVRIWFGAAPNAGDPDDPEPRGPWIWRAELNGVEVPIDRVWPSCAGGPIAESEYRYRLATFRHAVEHEPDLPEAAPYQPVDFGTLRFNFARTT